jgi:hypothetical protein
MQNYNCMNGNKNELLQRNVKSADDCKALCDSNPDCTTYEVDVPLTTCWLSKNIHKIDACCQKSSARQMYPALQRPNPDASC